MSTNSEIIIKFGLKIILSDTKASFSIVILFHFFPSEYRDTKSKVTNFF